MTFGLLSGILGGGGGSNATQSTNAVNNTGGNFSGSATAPSSFSINQFNQALNNAYTAGLNQGASFSQPTFSFGGSQQGGFPGGSQGFQTISNAQNNIANNLVSGINFGGSTQHTHGGFSHAHGGGAVPHGHGNISGSTGNVSHSHGSTTGTTSGGSANTNVFGSGLGGIFDTVDSLESNLLGGILGGSQTGGNVQASGGQSGGGLLGGLPLVGDLLGGGSSQGGGNGGILGGLLGGITGGGNGGGMLGGLLGGGGGGGLGGIVGAPLGLFSNLVGHDSAASAAANGDVMGWLVNTFDHTGHSHALGGNSGGGSSAPLAILGTLGQEAGGLVGLDKIFGSAQAYDANNGTNYAAHGSPNYGLTGGIGLGSLLGGGGASGGHGGHSGH